MTIRLVIFDCDGVLIDSEGISGRVLIGMLADLGVTVDFDYCCVNWVGRSFPTVAQDIRTRFDLVLPEDFERRYRSDLLAAFETDLVPTLGVDATLRQVRQPKCVATSSSPERVARSLAITNLAGHFGADVFTASEVKRGKPAPDLFVHAAEKMGFSPQDCLVIEDSLPGVEAAQAAGMEVLRFTGGVHLNDRVLKHAANVQTFDTWPELFVCKPELTRELNDGGTG